MMKDVFVRRRNALRKSRKSSIEMRNFDWGNSKTLSFERSNDSAGGDENIYFEFADYNTSIPALTLSSGYKNITVSNNNSYTNYIFNTNIVAPAVTFKAAAASIDGSDAPALFAFNPLGSKWCREN